MILLKIDLKKLLVALAVPLAVGGLSALLSRVATERFDSLEKPPLAPPSWVFPVVWTVLFVLMGIASYLVAVEKAEEKQKKAALTVYGIQLAFNFAWTLIFFNAVRMADHPVASDNRDNISVLKDQICRGAFAHSVCAVGRVRGISELFDISAEPMISLSENKKHLRAVVIPREMFYCI